MNYDFTTMMELKLQSRKVPICSIRMNLALPHDKLKQTLGRIGRYVHNINILKGRASYEKFQ